MNKTRRKAIDTLMARLEDLRLDVEYLLDEEQDAFNSLPESIQESENGFYDNLNQVVILAKYELGYLDSRTPITQAIIEVCKNNDLYPSGDSIEDYGAHLYFVRRCGKTWKRCCAVGDKVYMTDGIRIYEEIVSKIFVHENKVFYDTSEGTEFSIEAIENRNIFLTREEAEEKMNKWGERKGE